MQQYQAIILIALLLIIPTFIEAKSFQVENIQIGPNPLIPSHESLMISGTSNQPINLKSYIYSLTGEQILHKNHVITGGDFSVTFSTPFDLKKINQGLYIVYLVFSNDKDTIQKKLYLIMKE